MPDHESLMQHIWLLGGISLGGGGFASQIASVAGDLGFGFKVFITLSVGAIIFGSIYFFAPAHV